MNIKKTLSFFIIVAILLANTASLDINAASIDYDSQYIKVGLEQNFKSKTSLALSGDGFTIGLENTSVNELFQIKDKSIIAKHKNFTYHIELAESFSSYNQALEKMKSLNAQNIKAYIAYNAGYKIYIGEFANETSANQYLITNAALATLKLNIVKNEALISIENNSGQSIIFFDKKQKIYIKSLGNTTSLDDKKYRGYVGFVSDIKNVKNMTIVNYVKIGDYLKGVVPSEMPASWNIEALKAQTVAARNYAIRSLNKHKAQDYNLCDTEHCQAYGTIKLGGYDREHPNTNRAVDETRSKVLMYNKTIAETLYSSCNGGYIANNEDVWGGSPVAYLRAKKDIYYEKNIHSDWKVQISKAEASNKLKVAGYDVGQVLSIETKKDALGAYVTELKVTGTNGVKTVPKGRVRNIFGLKSANYIIEASGTSPSPVEPIPPKPIETNIDAFVLSANDKQAKKTSLNNINVITSTQTKKIDTNMEKVVISNGVEKIIKENKKQEEKPVTPPIPKPNLDTIVFIGSGNGHGVGMSQFGANSMAKKSFTYREILEYYYTGTRVE